MFRKRPVILGLSLLALISVALLALHLKRTPRILSDMSWTGSQKDSVVSSYHWQRGEFQSFELLMSGKPEGQSALFELAAKLRIVVLGEASDHFQVLLELTPENTTGFEQLNPEYKKALLDGMAQPVAARMGLRGFDLQLAGTPDGLLKEFWLGLTERSRVLLPERLPPQSLSQSETYFGSPVHARYSYESTDDDRQFHLQKTVNSDPSAPRQVDAEAVVVFQADFAGLKQIEFKSQDALPQAGMKAENALKLRWNGNGRLEEGDLQRLERRLQDQVSSLAALRQSVQSQVLGQRGFKDVWQALSSKTDQASYLLLKAWIQVKPDELSQLLAQLKGLDAQDPKLREAIKALTAVGSPEAQKVMVEILDQSLKDGNRELANRLVSSLGFVGEPTAQTVDRLTQLVRNQEFPETGRRAELALGIAANRLKSGESAQPQAAAQLESEALSRLAVSRSERETLVTLGMLGNLGPSSRQALAAQLASSSPELRAQAYFALRNGQEKDIPEFYAAQYKDEPSVEVRQQILQALLQRAPDAAWFGALQTLLGTGLNDEQQVAIAQILARHARDFPNESQKLLASLGQQGTPELKAKLAQYQTLAAQQASSRL